MIGYNKKKEIVLECSDPIDIVLFGIVCFIVGVICGILISFLLLKL
jgi:hypothetical protein